jgi:signal recognition particle receptor subunit beta
VKILLVGAFGVGKTTFVRTLSDIEPLLTEETITTASVGTDELRGIPGKTTTTVAMDFGRLSLSDELVLYLFGAPGQARFHDVVADLATGALGALVLADTRKLDESFPFIDMLEELGLPYAVAVNTFPNTPPHDPGKLAAALDLHPDTPLVMCDARYRLSGKSALIDLVRYLLTLAPEPVR